MKLCLVGGFLGSGKTTAIVAAAKMFARNNISVAVITNDQGSQLVDTALIHSLGIPGSEVRNGCFCCNYEQFYSAIENLKMSVAPQVIFAEAVGSCADLVATIVKPLNRFHPEINVSFAVFVDGPVLISSMEGRSSFVSNDIQYIYKKQIEEAGLIVINKCDLLTEDEIKKVQSVLQSEFPGRKLLFQDSHQQASVIKWMNSMQNATKGTDLTSLSIDYDKYAAGEAALAWLDATTIIHSKQRAIAKAYGFISDMVDEISFQKFAIGHLKFFLESGAWQRKISYTSVHNQRLDTSNPGGVADHVRIIVNARVETDPDRLKKLFYQTIQKTQHQHCFVEIIELASFQPGYPKPPYRLRE
jgi:G3E family GTPase